MYESFTDGGRRVMQFANQEAQRFSHEYIGTEHILLGLVKEGKGVAADILSRLGIGMRTIRLEIEKLVQSCPSMVTMGKLPLTPRVKKVIEYSSEEARNLNCSYVGTEHILLGLLREPEGVAYHVLEHLGVTLDCVRHAVLVMTKPITGGFYVECEVQDRSRLVFRDVDGVMKEMTSRELSCSRIAAWVIDAGTKLGVDLKSGKFPVTIKGHGIGVGVIDILVREGVLVVSHVPCKVEGEQYQVVKAQKVDTIRDRIDRIELELGQIKANLS